MKMITKILIVSGIISCITIAVFAFTFIFENKGKREFANDEQKIHVSIHIISDSIFQQYYYYDEYPIVDGMLNKSIQDSINKFFKNQAIKSYNYFLETKKTAEKDESLFSYPYGEETVCKVFFPTKTIITFNFYSSIYGGIHPAGGSHGYNFNLNNGKLLQIDDIFNSNSDYYKVLTDLTKAYYNSSFDWNGPPRKEDYQHFTIKDNGILFSFGHDRFDVGDNSILFTYSELSDILNYDLIPYKDLSNMKSPESQKNIHQNHEIMQNNEQYQKTKDKPNGNSEIYIHARDRLENFVYTIQDRIDKENLLTRTNIGNEELYTSKFLSISLNPEKYLSTDKYSERLWLVTLFVLSQHLAEISGKMNIIMDNNGNNELVKFILDRMGDITEVFKNKNSAEIISYRNVLGEQLRDIGVSIGAFESKFTTYSAAYGRLGGIVGGVSLVLSGLDGLDKLKKAKLIAQSVLVWYMLENYIIPNIKNHAIISNKFLNNAINNYQNSSVDYENSQQDIISTQVALDASAFLLGLRAAPMLFETGAILGEGIAPEFTPASGIVGGAILTLSGSILIGITPGSWTDGMAFELYNNISSRLFTIVYNTNKCSEGDIFINSLSLIKGLNIIEYNVRGKGIISGLGQLLGGEEKHWEIFYQTNIKPQNEDVIGKLKIFYQGFNN